MEPPKPRTSGWMIVLKVLLALFILLVVGALALVGLVFVVCSRH